MSLNTPLKLSIGFSTLSKSFKFDITWNLIDIMLNNQSFLPDHTAFRVLFKCYVSTHLVNEVLDAFVKSNEYNLRYVHTFSTSIDVFCRVQACNRS